MKIRFNHLILLMSIIMTWTFTACSQSEPAIIQEPTIYDGCCGTEPKIIKVEEYIVYVPNVITPNGDGINDGFYPQTNVTTNGFITVGNFLITNDTSKWLYFRHSLSVETAKDKAFKGIVNDKPLFPEPSRDYEYTGKFKYSFYIAFKLQDGTEHIESVEGEACVVRCDDDAHVIKNKQGCQFPVQGLNGIYDPLLPIQEEDCIK